MEAVRSSAVPGSRSVELSDAELRERLRIVAKVHGEINLQKSCVIVEEPENSVVDATLVQETKSDIIEARSTNDELSGNGQSLGNEKSEKPSGFDLLLEWKMRKLNKTLVRYFFSAFGLLGQLLGKAA